ncbi:MAG: hypothetical protein ABI927_04835, partial [Gaiellaceae bacterium]
MPDTRLPFERHVFRVVAQVILIRPELDSDIHLVLSDGNWPMIAEAPDPACAPGLFRSDADRWPGCAGSSASAA